MHAPTEEKMDHEKEYFYKQLDSKICQNYIRDFNEKIDEKNLERSLGIYGHHETTNHI